MSPSTRTLAKPSFCDICITHGLNSEKLQKIATLSGIPNTLGKLLADGKVKTEQRGDQLFCLLETRGQL